MFNKKHTLLAVSCLFVFSWVSVNAEGLSNQIKTTTQEPTTMEAVMPSALSISQINTIDSKKLEVLFNNNTNTFSTWSEVKVFNQLEVVEAKVLETNLKQVEVKISWEDLVDGSSLSLISLNDLDLNADFTITWENFSLDNLATPTWSKITVKDKSTLIIDLKADLVWKTPNLKLLKEVQVDWVSNLDSKLVLDLKDELKSSNSYIFMIISLFDNANKEVNVENWVFDFVTPETIQSNEKKVDEVVTLTGETLVEENMTLTGETLVENNMDTETLNVADTQSGAIAIEDVAMTAETTPDTGTKEIFIVLLSLMIWLGIFALKNKKA